MSLGISLPTVTVRTVTGSRRHAGTVHGGRRRGKRPRSAKDRTTGNGVASGHGRRRMTKDDGNKDDDGDEDMDVVTTHSEQLCEGSSQDGDKL